MFIVGNKYVCGKLHEQLFPWIFVHYNKVCVRLNRYLPITTNNYNSKNQIVLFLFFENSHSFNSFCLYIIQLSSFSRISHPWFSRFFWCQNSSLCWKIETVTRGCYWFKCKKVMKFEIVRKWFNENLLKEYLKVCMTGKEKTAVVIM